MLKYDFHLRDGIALRSELRVEDFAPVGFGYFESFELKYPYGIIGRNCWTSECREKYAV